MKNHPIAGCISCLYIYNVIYPFKFKEISDFSPMSRPFTGESPFPIVPVIVPISSRHRPRVAERLRSPVELQRSFPLPFPLKLFVNTSRAEAAAILHGQAGPKTRGQGKANPDGTIYKVVPPKRYKFVYKPH